MDNIKKKKWWQGSPIIPKIHVDGYKSAASIVLVSVWEKTKGSNGPVRMERREPQKGQQVLTEDHNRKSGEPHLLCRAHNEIQRVRAAPASMNSQRTYQDRIPQRGETTHSRIKIGWGSQHGQRKEKLPKKWERETEPCYPNLTENRRTMESKILLNLTSF